MGTKAAAAVERRAQQLTRSCLCQLVNEDANEGKVDEAGFRTFNGEFSCEIRARANYAYSRRPSYLLAICGLFSLPHCTVKK